MRPGLVVKLRPNGPWRIGPDSGARNRVDVIYHSDSLYAAVTSAMGRMGRLDEWLAATAGEPAPAVCFSSCFPFLHEIRLVVPPRTLWPPKTTSLTSGRVRWKSARFVPLDVVRAILAGEPLNEDEWSVDGPSECLVPAGRGGPFRTSVRWSAAVDRLTGTSERHATACIEFRPGAGLWTIAGFRDEAALARWLEPVKSAFRLLADSGFGGERSRGWGRSETPEFIEGSLPEMILADAGCQGQEGGDRGPGAGGREARLVAPSEILSATGPVPRTDPEPRPPDDEPEVPELASPVRVLPDPEPGPDTLPPLPNEPLTAGVPAVEAEPPLAPAPVFPQSLPEEPLAAAPQGESLTEEAPSVELEPPLALAPAFPQSLPDEPQAAAPQGESLTVEAPSVELEPRLALAPAFPQSLPDGPQAAAPQGESLTVEAPAVEAEPPLAPAAGPWPPAPEVPLAHRRRPPAPVWLLSLFTPAAADVVDWGRGNYAVLARAGRVDSPAGSGELKKQLQMVVEGSVLFAEGVPSGSAPDVAPEGFSHPVFRAGFALAIPLPEVG